MDKKYSLLIVDDEKDIVEMLYDFFRSDYTVHKAFSAREALDIHKENTIHLVMTDQRMPDMQGTELLAKLKETNPEITRLLMTGYTDLEAAIDAINKGSIHRYLTKPLNFEELGDIISEGLQYFEEAVKVKNLITSEKEDILGKIKGVMSKIKSMETDRGKLEQELSAAKEIEERHQKELETKIETLGEEKRAAETEMTELREKTGKEMTELREKTETEMTELREKLASLKDELDNSHAETGKVKEEAAESRKIETDYKELESRFSVVNKSSISLKKDLDTMSKELETAKAEKNRMEKKLKQFQANWGKAVA